MIVEEVLVAMLCCGPKCSIVRFSYTILTDYLRMYLILSDLSGVALKRAGFLVRGQFCLQSVFVSDNSPLRSLSDSKSQCCLLVRESKSLTFVAFLSLSQGIILE